MFRKCTVTVAAILTAVILITVTFLGFGLTDGTALAATNITIDWEENWVDLETGEVIVWSIMYYEPPSSEYDFKFSRVSTWTPSAVLIHNDDQSAKIAYSEEDYDNVEFTDVATLSFTTSIILVPFNKVAVINTFEGNYFKVGFVRIDPDTVTFQYDQLFPSYDEIYETGYQAGLDDASENIDAFLGEIKNLLATPPGQRSSTSLYEGELGDELNEIIEMLLAPQGSNISGNTPQGKKK